MIKKCLQIKDLGDREGSEGYFKMGKWYIFTYPKEKPTLLIFLSLFN